jgi:DNA-directed RNA polymerase subunit RPC12/RpoP
MPVIRCQECGAEFGADSTSCPHCGAHVWVAAQDLTSRPQQSRPNDLKEVGLYEAVAAGLAIIGGVIAFIEPAYGFLLVGTGLVVFLIGRFK